MKQIKLGSIVIVFILLTMLTCSIFSIAVDGNTDEGAVDGGADITDKVDVGDEDDETDTDDKAGTGDETDTDDETDSESDDESDSDSEADDDGMYEALEEAQITVGRVVFSPETNISTLEFKGEASFKNQLLSLTSGSKPVIKIHNTTHGSWSLSVKYSPFTVNTKADTDIRFAIRDETGNVADSNNNLYRVFNPNVSQLVHKASGSDSLYSVPWDESNNAVLKVFLSSYRHDLNSKTINSKLTWTIEVTPTSGDVRHDWTDWDNHTRVCKTCGETDSHDPEWDDWKPDNNDTHSRICVHCLLNEARSHNWIHTVSHNLEACGHYVHRNIRRCPDCEHVEDVGSPIVTFLNNMFDWNFSNMHEIVNDAGRMNQIAANAAAMTQVANSREALNAISHYAAARSVISNTTAADAQNSTAGIALRGSPFRQTRRGMPINTWTFPDWGVPRLFVIRANNRTNSANTFLTTMSNVFTRTSIDNPTDAPVNIPAGSAWRQLYLFTDGNSGLWQTSYGVTFDYDVIDVSCC